MCDAKINQWRNVWVEMGSEIRREKRFKVEVWRKKAREVMKWVFPCGYGPKGKRALSKSLA